MAVMAGRVAELLVATSVPRRPSSHSSQHVSASGRARAKCAASAVSSGACLLTSFCRPRTTGSSAGRARAIFAGAGGTPARDEETLLKKKAADLAPHLSGSSIFLVGMSRTDKSTVGKHLSQALGYYFFDSMELVETAAGDAVREMIEQELLDAETEVLMQLSPMVRLVVATGEGAVVSPRNWSYLRTGVTVWIDVPADHLIQTIAESEPPPELVDDTRKMLRARAEYYANADVTVSIEELAAKKNIDDLASLTAPMVALHVLEEIDRVLKKA
ncbi:protein MpSK2 [Marchantia polymorpha subsp. ruderalis]|uniref:Shikimate kinase n=2 Tax=Marchantia polymorpha TaxID=3197 RepID=A0AAF6BN69_MARPO|nr:hypothetical protein MARPO_0035s0139 [Marchantia polymorpha]BBN13453.1 hypothetical protein Mp_6g03600 [Marchantia polymorpha subsp. ruderalis]|eukprot:PTQ41373.1 hypothetical protein MARPO_0035s0139 [Marchantia polymorpha]